MAAHLLRRLLASQGPDAGRLVGVGVFALMLILKRWCDRRRAKVYAQGDVRRGVRHAAPDGCDGPEEDLLLLNVGSYNVRVEMTRQEFVESAKFFGYAVRRKPVRHAP